MALKAFDKVHSEMDLAGCNVYYRRIGKAKNRDLYMSVSCEMFFYVHQLYSLPCSDFRSIFV